MSFRNVYCVMVMGTRLNEEVLDVLFDTAQLMTRRNLKKRQLLRNGFEGQVKTTYERASLGGLVGILFHAVVETEEVTATVDYLVRPCDLGSEVIHWNSGRLS